MRLALPVAGLVAACAAPSPETPVTWQLDASRGESTLVAVDAQGPLLGLACRPGGKQMLLTAFRFTPVPSNEEFALGIDESAFLFVADPTAPASGVVATGPIFLPVLDGLLSAGTVSAAYGAEAIGPLPLPADEADAFAGACRGMM